MDPGRLVVFSHGGGLIFHKNHWLGDEPSHDVRLNDSRLEAIHELSTASSRFDSPFRPWQLIRSNRLSKLLGEYNIQMSMSRKDSCYDNASIESFHSVIKKELIFHEKYQGRKEVKKSIFDYIMTSYNYERIHSAIDYFSSLQYEKNIF